MKEIELRKLEEDALGNMRLYAYHGKAGESVQKYDSLADYLSRKAG